MEFGSRSCFDMIHPFNSEAEHVFHNADSKGVLVFWCVADERGLLWYFIAHEKDWKCPVQLLCRKKNNRGSSLRPNSVDDG